jgi:Bacterial Ig-like domain
MAIPTITSVTPANLATGVILGGPITVTFSEIMDHASITSSNFALISPQGTMIITPDEEMERNPSPIAGKKNISGTFTFDDRTGVTVVTFVPGRVLIPNITYTVIIIGAGAYLVSNPVMGADATPLASNYSWSFTTGTLDLVIPPSISPLPNNPDIDPWTDIIVIPRTFPNPNGTDLTQEIDLVFEAPVDPTSFSLSNLLLSVDSILGDPSVTIPPGLIATAVIAGNIIKITITGWPA